MTDFLALAQTIDKQTRRLQRWTTIGLTLGLCYGQFFTRDTLAFECAFDERLQPLPDSCAFVSYYWPMLLANGAQGALWGALVGLASSLEVWLEARPPSSPIARYQG